MQTYGQIVVDDGLRADWGMIGTALEALQPVRLDIARELDNPDVRGSLHDAAVVLVGARSCEGAPSEILIERLRQELPHVGAYVCLRLVPAMAARARMYADAGADGLILLEGTADLHFLAYLMRARVAAPPPEREIRRVVEAVGPCRALSLAEYCLRTAFRRVRGHDVATWFGIDRKTVRSLLHASAFPTSSVLTRCGRHFHANELERRGIRSREAVARRLGFTDASALRTSRTRLRTTLGNTSNRGIRVVSLLKSLIV
ncbi:MAG TPA: hypothetical protein VJL28_00120 [Gemmatimonadaceae bacterium]|nr:hypothetical protein [Gemmatimonadaceae bacterium]HLA88818.1 hypothetical protein [Gemmatimonadaceae bacterium]